MKSKSTAQQGKKPISLSPAQLEAKKDQFLIIDVRSFLEYLLGHIPGAQRLNRNRILKEIPKTQAIAVVCLSGHRSNILAQWLVEQGYEKVYNLQGGLMAQKGNGYSLKFGNRP